MKGKRDQRHQNTASRGGITTMYRQQRKTGKNASASSWIPSLFYLIPLIAMLIFGSDVLFYNEYQNDHHSLSSSSLSLILHQVDTQSFNTTFSVLSMDRSENSTVQSDSSSSSFSQDPLAYVLETSGILEKGKSMEQLLRENNIQNFPTWNQLEDMYGSKPVILGLETCATYRERVPPDQRYTAPAGMFNSGTNALYTNMLKNLKANHYMQVPWGKHRMASGRNHFHVEKLQHVNHTAALPVVIVRDPYFWMQSMCKSPYQAHWKRRPKHCPNLVVDANDRSRLQSLVNETGETFRVKVIHDAEYKLFYDSLAHLWNEFYRPYYYETSYPRLIVRFEDLLWSAPTIMHHIAECMGTSLISDVYQYQVKRAKGHGSKSGLLEAIVKTGNLAMRGAKLTKQDLEFARDNLDPEMMQNLHYSYL